MSTNPLPPSLLRPPILHILRAAGFTTTRPSVLDTLVDLASRHLTLLAAHTARHALLRLPSPPQQQQPPHPPTTTTITDVRLALQDAGALYPQMGAMEEQARGDGEEDMRGVEAFIAWCTGPGALEIRRVAGLGAAEASTLTTTTITTAAAGGNTIDLSATATALGGKGGGAATTTERMISAVERERAEDWLAVLKKKHAKTRDGEESRWAGTVLGRDKEREGGVRIEGWEGVEGLGVWGERFRGGGDGVLEVEVEGEGEMEMGVGAGGSESSSPLSEISAATAT